MKTIYGVISDPHYHSWSAFSTISVNGLNSRLKIQLEATIEAAKAIKASGAKYMLVAGDTFHTRGSITPTVLHFVTEAYKEIINEIGLEVWMLAGKAYNPEAGLEQNHCPMDYYEIYGNVDEVYVLVKAKSIYANGPEKLIVAGITRDAKNYEDSIK